jgi:AraC-like DNA-binding protein
MPVLRELPPYDQINPDKVRRKVVAFGITTPSLEHERSRHRKAELILTTRGVLTSEVDSGLWLVPPHSALWIPPNTFHSLKSSGEIEGYCAFLAPGLAAGLPQHCCTIAVTPLLRELLIRASNLPLHYPERPNAYLLGLLVTEIAAASVQQLHLPMPEDGRLRTIVDALMAAPSERGTMEHWAQRAGLSRRSLARLLARETGMSFGRWRQQLGIMMALRWLAGGASIQQVAHDLGYESAGSFVTMFRKTVGLPPARYMSSMRARAASGE